VNARLGTRGLVAVWIALVLLLAGSAASSLVDLGWGNVAVNLLVAAAKTALIGMFYMRLRHSLGAVRVAIAVMLLIFALLIGLSMADVVTRG
jgi:cytochrome c oxidase subunit 4